MNNNQIIIPDIRMPEEPLSFELEELLYSLGHGAENAKSRKMLTREMDISDRKLRKLISEARERDIVILNRCEGKGYYILDLKDGLAQDELDDLEAMYRRERKRALSILKWLSFIKRILRIEGRRVA